MQTDYILQRLIYLIREPRNIYLKGDYDKAEFTADKAFEALKNADKLDFALSHSYISDRPKLRMNCQEDIQPSQSGIS